MKRLFLIPVLLAFLNGAAVAAETCSVSAAFSPSGGAENLVLSSLAGARSSIRMAAYSLTADRVVTALITAKRRGVDVAVVADEKTNRNTHGQTAIQRLTDAGIPVSLYRGRMQHNKYAVIDVINVQTGSYNYSKSAAISNNENVITISNCQSLAGKYLENWQSLAKGE